MSNYEVIKSGVSLWDSENEEHVAVEGFTVNEDKYIRIDCN